MQSFWCVYKWRVNPNTYACICRQYETQCMRVMKTHTQTHIKYIQTYEWWHISMQFAAARPQSHSDVSISPFELFKPLQFRLISKIYEFGSQQITHPLISPLSLSQRGVGGVGRGGGGGGFPPFMSMDKHSGWRTRLSANQALLLPLTLWLKAVDSFSCSTAFFPKVSTWQWRREKKERKSGCLLEWLKWKWKT